MLATVSTETIDKMVNFVKTIGIEVSFGEVTKEKEFLPGICIDKGGLLIDMERLKYPGDILHEAGHLAVATPDDRKAMDGVLYTGTDQSAGEEMMAIAWSYAAAKHLDIEMTVVFHEGGYKGGSNSIINNFSQGRYFGVPLLEWAGLTKQAGTSVYPNMIKWVREQ